MSWKAFQDELKENSTGCAFITLKGECVAPEGEWDASQKQVSNYPELFNNELSTRANGIYYKGERYLCTVCDEERIFAKKG